MEEARFYKHAPEIPKQINPTGLKSEGFSHIFYLIREVFDFRTFIVRYN